MIRALGIHELPAIGPAVLAMGVFDGVHLGHRSMLEGTRDGARIRGCAGVVLVFDPHPEEVLRPGIAVPYLAPLEVNLARIRAVGIDRALPMRFDTALRELTAEAFLDALARSLDLQGLVMSPESAFGRDRGGTVERMRQLGMERGFEVITVEPTIVDGAVVSSSRVRDAIAGGDLAAARRLGAVPCIAGNAGTLAGDGLLTLEPGYLPVLPPGGRYAGWLQHGEGTPRAAILQIADRGAAAPRIAFRVVSEPGITIRGEVTVEPVTLLAPEGSTGRTEPLVDEDRAAMAALELASAGTGEGRVWYHAPVRE